MVALSREEGAPTLREVSEARERDIMTGAHAMPLVRSVLRQFPGAEIVAVRTPEAEPAPTTAAPPPAGDEDVGYIDDAYNEDEL
jgi:DNA polymerase-3 subunit gamma/tau